MSSKHPGFKAVAKKIAEEQDISIEQANAILAARTRGASASAKKHNSRLKNVQKSLGSSYETAKMMPFKNGRPDWESVDAHTFVIIPINNRKSSLHGRFVVLEKLSNGLYKIARNPAHTKKNDEHYDDWEDERDDRDLDVEHLEKDTDEMDKGLGKRTRRVPDRSSSRTYTRASYIKKSSPIERLRESLQRHANG